MCCAGSRLLVQERVAETLYSRIRTRMETLRVGHPLDKAIDIGAIVSPVQLESIRRMVDAGVAEGARCWQPRNPLPEKGSYFPPTLLTDVHPTATVAQEEIFGPVLAAMTFRTPAEAAELANNTVYGLAASIWSENINVALDLASQVKAGVVWVNSTNQFDAACGFGGYRESGYGREGGREGMFEYLTPKWLSTLPPAPSAANRVETSEEQGDLSPAGSPIDRTVKQYIGGKQARPDSGYSFPVFGQKGELLGEAPLGNRKDIRNAVEAARAASGWARTTAALRAQIIYYIAENMIQRRDEIAHRLAASRRRGAGRGRNRSLHRAHLHLRGVGRQIRRSRPSPARTQHHHRHARTSGDHRHSRSIGSAAPRFALPRAARPLQWATPW